MAMLHVLNSKRQIRVGTPGPLNHKRQIAVGTTGPQQQAPDHTGHCRTSTASARSQWALPDPNCKCMIAVGTPGPLNSKRQIRVGTPGPLNHKRQIAVGTTGPQQQAPDHTGHCQTSTASARSQWALPDPNCKCMIAVGTPGPLNSKRQIAVGTTGPQLQVPDRSGHYRAPTASARSQWALPDLNSKRQIAVGTNSSGPHTASARTQWAAYRTSSVSSRSRNGKRQIAARSPWALSRLNRQLPITVATTVLDAKNAHLLGRQVLSPKLSHPIFSRARLALRLYLKGGFWGVGKMLACGLSCAHICMNI